jgi:methylated-DNA-protein-cysteine methyltransferase related protein
MTPKEQIIKLVNLIPEGKVSTFGEIAKHIQDHKISAQMVGWILSGMKTEEWKLCPWYRVVNKEGFISSLKLGSKGLVQKQILLGEGYTLIEDNVDMQKHFWGFGGDSELDVLF